MFSPFSKTHMIEEPKQASVWWSSSCAHEIKEDTTMKIFVFLFLLCLETKESWLHASAAAAHRNASPVVERLSSVRNICRAAHPHIKLTQLGKHQRIEMSQLVSLRHLYLSPITSHSSLLQPVQDGRGLQQTALVGQQRQRSNYQAPCIS